MENVLRNQMWLKMISNLMAQHTKSQRKKNCCWFV